MDLRAITIAVRKEERITELVVCVNADRATPFSQDLSIVRIFSAVNVASRSEVAAVSIAHAMQPILLRNADHPDNGVWSIIV
jgi:hypothetical protein